MGSLDKFSFMLIMGDQKEPDHDDEAKEAMVIKSLNLMSALYIMIIDYQNAVHDMPDSFNGTSSRLDIYPDNDRKIGVIADSPDKGTVYYICKIENERKYKKIISRNQVLTIEQAYSQILGFQLICSS